MYVFVVFTSRHDVFVKTEVCDEDEPIKVEHNAEVCDADWPVKKEIKYDDVEDKENKENKKWQKNKKRKMEETESTSKDNVEQVPQMKTWKRKDDSNTVLEEQPVTKLSMVDQYLQQRTEKEMVTGKEKLQKPKEIIKGRKESFTWQARK